MEHIGHAHYSHSISVHLCHDYRKTFTLYKGCNQSKFVFHFQDSAKLLNIIQFALQRTVSYMKYLLEERSE